MGRKKYVLPVKKIGEMAARGLSEEQIAQALGISLSTLKRHKGENELLQATLKKGKALGISDVANALYAAAIGGNITAMIFFLKNRDPSNWRDRQEADDDGEPPQPAKVEIIVKDGRKAKD